MKAFILCCFVAFAAANADLPADPTPVVEASAPVAPAAGGRLSIEQETLDLGTVVRGQTATATFLLRNTGDETLAILSAKPG